MRRGRAAQTEWKMKAAKNPIEIEACVDESAIRCACSFVDFEQANLERGTRDRLKIEPKIGLGTARLVCSASTEKFAG